MVSFIIWNGSPVVFSIGPFVLRWYILLFIIAFVLGRQLLLYVYKKEGKSATEVETLAKYIFISAIIGARFGYVVFYEPQLIWTKPLEIFLPIQLQPSFRFTGMEKLSGYGALLGIAISIGIYCFRKKSKQNYLQVLDRVLIIVALAGFFTGLGNFFNAEIPGKPTDSKSGVVFTRPVTDGVTKIPCCIMRNPGGRNPLDKVSVKKDTALTSKEAGHSPLLLYLFYEAGATEQLVKEFLIGDVKTFLYDNSQTVVEPGDEPLHYTIFQEKDDLFTARVRTTGIARHPTQLYESALYLAVFVILFFIWKSGSGNIRDGSLTGIFFCLTAAMTFAVGYLKESQVNFENGMALNVTQILSIPLFLLGLVLLAMTFRKTALKA